MSAHIFKPARSAMSSGTARTEEWVLQHDATSRQEIDPLMGWTSTRDMGGQITLSFATKEEAIAYAERNGIAYLLTEPHVRKPIRKSYSDNFKFGRVGSWTH